MRSLGKLNTILRYDSICHEIIILILCVCLAYTLKCQNYYPSGARSAAMGHASVSMVDFWAAFNNQAGISEINHICAGVYFENKYLIKNLNLKSAALIIPVSKGVFSISILNFGNHLFHENKYGLAFAKSFSKTLYTGIQLDIIETNIGDVYGKKYNGTFEAGICVKLNNKITIGVHCFHPLNVKLADYNNERISAIFRYGISYHVSEQIDLTSEICKNIYSKPVLRMGFEYELNKFAVIRTGISTNPMQQSFGIGLKHKGFIIDFSSSTHQVLGLSPQFSLLSNLQQ